MATAMMAETAHHNYESKRDSLRKQWQESKSMPRKKKKKTRKHLKLDWKINEWGNSFSFKY